LGPIKLQLCDVPGSTTQGFPKIRRGLDLSKTLAVEFALPTIRSALTFLFNNWAISSLFETLNQPMEQ
jgi:hypothetical protein